MTATPCSFSRWIRPSTCSTCRTEIAAVGSSIITSLALDSRVRAIATAWRWPPDICLTRSSRPRLRPAARRTAPAHAPPSPCDRARRTGRICASARGRGTRWPQPSDCRQARGPDRRPRCPTARASIGRWKCDRVAVEADLAMAGAEIAGDDLDQRRLAGAVVAHQADHLAREDLHIDAMQRADRAELLADARSVRGPVVWLSALAISGLPQT